MTLLFQINLIFFYNHKNFKSVKFKNSQINWVYFILVHLRIILAS